MSSEPLKMDEQTTKFPSLSETHRTLMRIAITILRNPTFQAEMARLRERHDGEQQLLMEKWIVREIEKEHAGD